MVPGYTHSVDADALRLTLSILSNSSVHDRYGSVFVEASGYWRGMGPNIVGLVDALEPAARIMKTLGLIVPAGCCAQQQLNVLQNCIK